jgi:hypothetical protein
VLELRMIVFVHENRLDKANKENVDARAEFMMFRLRKHFETF